MAERRTGGYFGFPLIYKILIGLVVGGYWGDYCWPCHSASKTTGGFLYKFA